MSNWQMRAVVTSILLAGLTVSIPAVPTDWPIMQALTRAASRGVKSTL